MMAALALMLRFGLTDPRQIGAAILAEYEERRKTKQAARYAVVHEDEDMRVLRRIEP